jgi:hypothetical protein
MYARNAAYILYGYDNIKPVKALVQNAGHGQKTKEEYASQEQ